MTDDMPGGDPTDSGRGFMSWLPWILLAVLGVVIVGALVFAQGDDEGSSETTTTAAETTTTVEEEA